MCALAELNDELRAFMADQQMFFVATAPLAADGHVNISPKGLDSFRVLGPNRVGYLDMPGSGVETIAHLRENGRITLMFCALRGRPRIVRLYGTGRAIEPTDSQWRQLARQFPLQPAARSLIVVELTRVADSCGYGVPLYEFQAHRSQLIDWAGRKGQQGVLEYQAHKNRHSIDGLPGLRRFDEPDASAGK
jgi:hypothetical protein